ncbi:MAG: exodeoxyribonuclease VII small subunit [Gammaproteobacteria bacterium SHHR-1]|uniref:exodeoxyribonuclease VII small subunit n=1 Tax=Magnetovirga frankeli TaxID=947516 RepID=UPI001292EDB2|nr:exodeoxyribonuclease VII small subunit [gamma proteobacterium SS-5]
MVTKKSKPIDFEASLKELETLVASMEQGDMSLEDSLKAFERGVALTRQCRDTLQQAEQRVSILSQESDQLEVFNSDA